MVKVEETTQGVLIRSAKALRRKVLLISVRMVFPSVTVTANISK